jgi:hypothetical protein
MKFIPNKELMSLARSSLSKRKGIYWIVGGAGSGKTTICRAISEKLNIAVYDMDEHVYGSYHGRFNPERHPVNTAWSKAQDPLAWLMVLTWEEFDEFNQAALPEYLDLLAEDLSAFDPAARMIIDGGICNPGLAVQALSPHQVVCLYRPNRSSADIWQENAERNSMKEVIFQLPDAEQAWQKFLEFDRRITQTILEECLENKIPVCIRKEGDSVEDLAGIVSDVLGI